MSSIKGSVAKGHILNSDFTLSKCYVVKGGGHFAHGETLGAARDALEQKLFDDMDVEDKTKIFMEKFELETEYSNKDFFEWHNKLTGSCEMGRLSFAKDHNIDIENGTMTVQEFINLTKDSFGRDAIRTLAKELGLEEQNGVFIRTINS